MKKLGFMTMIIGLVIFEQWVKLWTVASFNLGEVRPFLPEIFSLTYLRNYGAAFSILQNQQLLFAVVTFLVLGAASYYLFKKINVSNWQNLALVLIIAGGLGNFLDRLRLGYVVDMIQLDFMEFAIFNVADVYLTLGVILLILVFWREEHATRN